MTHDPDTPDLTPLLASAPGAPRIEAARRLAERCPWREVFSKDDQAEMVRSLADAADTRSLDHVAQVLREWRNTASALADPEIAAALNQPVAPSGSVPRPDVSNHADDEDEPVIALSAEQAAALREILDGPVPHWPVAPGRPRPPGSERA